MEIVFERIGLLLVENNISQASLCKTLGFSKNTIKNWQNNNSMAINIAAIAGYFEVSMDFLYGLTSERKQYKPSLHISDTALDILQSLADEQRTSLQVELLTGIVRDMIEFAKISCNNASQR